MTTSKDDAQDASERGDRDGKVMERWFSIAGGGTSVIINAFLVWRILSQPLSITLVLEVVLATVVLNAALLASLIYLSFAYARKERKLRKLSIQKERLSTRRDDAELLNGKISEQRAVIAGIHSEYCVLLRDRMFNKQFSDLQGQLNAYLESMLGQTASLFTTLTGEACAACIKVCVGADGSLSRSAKADSAPKPDVMTLRRDDRSHAQRKSTDQRYPRYRYNDNAGFRLIMDDETHPDWFFSDDLKGMGRAYFSRNVDFSKDYNACLQVPIKRGSMKASEECLGFICIDNMTGGLANMRCVHIVNGIAEDLYYSLGTTLGLIESKAD